MRPPTEPDVRGVTRYLAALPPEKRRALARLRALVRQLAPRAVERLSYGMPSFELDGPLVYYAAFADHLSLFPASVRTVRQFRDELRSFDVRKGTIRFSVDRPLPTGVLRRIVRARIAENRARRRAQEPPRARAPAAPASRAGKARDGRRRFRAVRATRARPTRAGAAAARRSPPGRRR